jgi:hypothetical protein
VITERLNPAVTNSQNCKSADLRECGAVFLAFDGLFVSRMPARSGITQTRVGLVTAWDCRIWLTSVMASEMQRAVCTLPPTRHTWARVGGWLHEKHLSSFALDFVPNHEPTDGRGHQELYANWIYWRFRRQRVCQTFLKWRRRTMCSGLSNVISVSPQFDNDPRLRVRAAGACIPSMAGIVGCVHESRVHEILRRRSHRTINDHTAMLGTGDGPGMAHD